MEDWGSLKESERLARFQREAKLLASLNHPKAISVARLETALHAGSTTTLPFVKDLQRLSLWRAASHKQIMSPRSEQMSTGSVIHDGYHRAPRRMQRSAFPGENSALLDA